MNLLQLILTILFTAATSTDSTTTYYYAIVTYSEGSCETVTSDLTAVVVTQTPVIENDAISVYTDDTFTYDPTTEGNNTVPTGTMYTWTILNNPGNITGASAVTTPEDVISQTLTNIGTTDITISYTVTPTHNGCLGLPFQLNVTVNAPLKVVAIVTDASCFKDGSFQGNGSILTTISGGFAPYSATWTALNGYTLTATDIIDNTSNIENLEGEVYTLKITDANGNSFTEDYTITQPTLDPIVDTNTTIICIDETPEQLALSYTGGLGIPVYQWYRNTTGTNTPGTSDAITDANGNVYTPLPADLTPNAINYFFATIKLEGCSPVASEVFTIETQASPTITTQPLASQEVCIEGIAETLEIAAATSASSNTITVQWYANTTGIRRSRTCS